MKTTRRNQKGFAHVGLFLLIVLVAAAIGFAGFKVFNSDDKNSLKGNQENSEKQWTKGCTNNSRVNMTHLPMNIEDVSNFTPYGITAGAHVTPVDHLYFYPNEGPRDTYPVFAMADGFITEITVRGINVDSGEARPPEYRYMIQHSCETITYYDLVTKIDDSILNEYPKASSEGMRGRFPVKGGQIVGWIGEQSLDTAVYNMNLILPGFITPEMYEAEPWKIHTDDFFSYFSAEHQAQMLALSERKVEPYSGKIDFDLPGKLIGNWFEEGTNGYAGAGEGTGEGYWVGHLAVFYHHIDPNLVVVSLGEFKGGDPQAFAVSGNTPDPATISTTSGVVKYELIQVPHEGTAGPISIKGVVLFQVLEGEKLKAEVFPDKTASQVSGFVNPTTYER